MRVNEPEDERLKRLEQYRICQKRGHVAGYMLGPINVYGHCGVYYEWVLREDPTTLPTGVNRFVEGTNMTKWTEVQGGPLPEGTRYYV